MGRLIRAARKSRGWSQERLAEEVRGRLADATVTQSAVSFWESGSTMPSRRRLGAVESALGFRPGELAAALHVPLGSPPNRPTPEQEERLERLEEKVDQILEHLAARTPVGRDRDEEREVS